MPEPQPTSEKCVDAEGVSKPAETRLKFVKEIYDNVLGFIPLTEIELEIVNHPLFQRLKRISQLGNAVHVFPGATHSRFSHSLGVMHIAGRMALKVSEDSGWDNYEIQKIRLAGLLHDIGHYPYSHVIEQVYKEKYSSSYHHEKVGSRVINDTSIKDILKKGGYESIEIGDIFNGKHREDRFNQILHSELDADRMDYLLRDSYHVGVKYGNYDIDQIIRKLTINKQGYVSVDYHAQRTVEHYIMARFNMYAQVITHKTIGAFDAMLKRLYKKGIDEGTFPDATSMVERINQDDYESFDDPYLISKIVQLRKSKKSDISRLAEMYLTRRPLKCAVQTSDLVDGGKTSAEHGNYRMLKMFLESTSNQICAGVPNEWIVVEADNYTELCPMLEPRGLFIKKGAAGKQSYDYQGQDLSKCIWISKKDESIPLVYDSTSLVCFLAGYRLEQCVVYTLEDFRDNVASFLSTDHIVSVVDGLLRPSP